MEKGLNINAIKSVVVPLQRKKAGVKGTKRLQGSLTPAITTVGMQGCCQESSLVFTIGSAVASAQQIQLHWKPKKGEENITPCLLGERNGMVMQSFHEGDISLQVSRTAALGANGFA